MADGTSYGGALVDWAVEAIAQGLDSPSLLRLAAHAGEEAPSLVEATTFFRAALAELGFTVPGDDEARLAWLERRAQAIVDGVPDLDAELFRIHDTVVTPLNHRDDVNEWCYLYERLATGRDEPLTDEEIREAARAWLARRRQAT